MNTFTLISTKMGIVQSNLYRERYRATWYHIIVNEGW